MSEAIQAVGCRHEEFSDTEYCPICARDEALAGLQDELRWAYASRDQRHEECQRLQAENESLRASLAALVDKLEELRSVMEAIWSRGEVVCVPRPSCAAGR